MRDLPADIANRVPVEVAELDFVGAFCRATLQVRGARDVAMTADFSSNLIRDLGVELRHASSTSPCRPTGCGCSPREPAPAPPSCASACRATTC